MAQTSVALYNLSDFSRRASHTLESDLSVEDLLLTILAVAALSMIVIAANIADRDKRSGMRRAVIAVIAITNGWIVLLYGVMQIFYAFTPLFESPDLAPPGKAEAIGSLILSLVVGGLATAILHQRVREKLAVLFLARRPAEGKTLRQAGPQSDMAPDLRLTARPDGTPLFPQMLNYYTTDDIIVPRSLADRSSPAMPGPDSMIRGFNPDSTVHMVAAVYCVYLLGIQFINFILGGGLEGIAESFAGELTAWDLLLNALPLLIVPVLGVGLGMRRTLPQTLDRLGLKVVTVETIAVAFGATVALLIFVAVVSMLWMGAVSEETYKEQTKASEALSESVNSLGIAFLLAATAAISEEIAFRGALQPIIGFWPTAIVFALTHAQYTLTPATLIILVVAVAFGWIRNRYSTTAAILTHFLYNFIPLALTVMMAEESSLWLLRIVG